MRFSRLLSILFCGAALTSRACDLCGCFTPQMETAGSTPESSRFSWARGWYAAAGAQFTDFGTLQNDGHEVDNPTGQYLHSWITQLVAGFGINDRFALQLNVPLIYRDFKRPEGFRIDEGSASGLGDLSLLLKTVAYKYDSGARRTFDTSGKNPVAIEQEPDFTLSIVLLTGLKFPTGDTGRLLEEFHETEVPGAPPSGIHGHDLTLGTGSWDGIFGGQTSLRYLNWFFESGLQFTLRGDGAHEYHFANDLLWSAGPGYYFVRNHGTVAGLQFLVTGEHKDVDRFRGAAAADTGITELAVGPRIVAARGRWSAEFAAEVPVVINNTALQAVPDYRLRASVAVQF